MSEIEEMSNWLSAVNRVLEKRSRELGMSVDKLSVKIEEGKLKMPEDKFRMLIEAQMPE